MQESIIIVGAGFSGAVIANELARSGYKITVYESRSHVAGNCHTERDTETDVMMHVYGPHIFHTNNKMVWDYIRKFDEFMPFINRVKAVYDGKVYSLPINLLTINAFFDLCLSPTEAKAFITDLGDSSIVEPQTFEEQALKFVGKELYEAFFKNYTIKQWGIHPDQLPASILKRLPVRFNYDDNYYNSKYQGIPKHGYTHIVEKMLSHENIELKLNTEFAAVDAKQYRHVFYSGPIDAWFSHSQGHLSYRTLDFLKETHVGDFQGNAVINYSDYTVPWTRTSEHKHFAPWESHDATVIYKEFSRECETGDIPYYPIRLVDDKAMLEQYVSLAESLDNVTFIGRLGTYRYLDMHITIEEALSAVKAYLESERKSDKMPAFIRSPI